MSNPEFPTDFVTPELVLPRYVAAKNSMVIDRLNLRGIDVLAGLDEESVPDLTEIADQFGTREYCLNDITRRWPDIPTSRKQLAKDGGRGVVLFRSQETQKNMAFGWLGASSDKERRMLPNCQITFALRIHEDLRGQGFGASMSEAICVVGAAAFSAYHIGLETWGSNKAAVKSYIGAQATTVTTEYGDRPTQINRLGTFYKDYNGQSILHCNDVRQYMEFVPTFR